jgi:predicted ABC-type ATPase
LPELIIVAGPNGSGKSTLTKNNSMGCPVIDPDAIARDIIPEPGITPQIQAGKLAAERWNLYAQSNTSFAVETTLSGKAYLKKMKDLKSKGWHIRLIFIGIESPETNIRRVAERVINGGHDVPTADIRRRYQRSMENLPKALEIADAAIIYDNSTEVKHQLIATIEQGKITLHSSKCPQWFQQAMSLQQ